MGVATDAVVAVAVFIVLVLVAGVVAVVAGVVFLVVVELVVAIVLLLLAHTQRPAPHFPHPGHFCRAIALTTTLKSLMQKSASVNNQGIRNTRQ